MTMCDAGAINLAVGIVRQAAEDYRYAQKMSRLDQAERKKKSKCNTSRDPKCEQAPEEQMALIEKFFLGKWFHMLVDLDGEEVLWLLKEGRQNKKVRARYGKSSRNYLDDKKRRNGPGRPIDWEAAAQWPDIKRRLEDGNYTRTQVAVAMGVKDCGQIKKMLRCGTEKTRRRILRALELLEADKEVRS